MASGKMLHVCPPPPGGRPASSGLADFVEAAARKGCRLTILSEADSMLITPPDPASAGAPARGDREPDGEVSSAHPVDELVTRLVAGGRPVALQLSKT